MYRTITRVAVVALALAACGGSGDSTNATTGTTGLGISSTTAGTAPPESSTTAPPGQTPAFTIDDDLEVVIDWESVSRVSFLAPVPNATDPLFFIHNEPGIDGFYLGLEAYTAYGPGWTGQLGTFALDCENNGICLHFDPDGPGPDMDAGLDFMTTGTIEIIRADIDGFEAILTDVVFTDGTTIPGPLRITGGNAH